MSDMGVPSFIVDQDVIKKNEDKMTYKGLKDVVHETLEIGRCIAKAKGHHQEIVVVFMSEKRNFGNVCCLHANLVVVRMDIKFGEELRTFELIQEVINDGKEKIIIDCDFFESSKVRTHVPSALFLEDHEN